MSGDTHHIDELFRNGMEGHSEMPSPLVWDKIEKALDKKDDSKRPFILFFTQYKKIWMVLGVAVLCIVLLTMGVCYVNSYTEKDINILNEKAVAETKQPRPAVESPESSVAKAQTLKTNPVITELTNKKHNHNSNKSEKLILNNIGKKEIQKNLSVSTQLNQSTAHLSSNAPNKQRLNDTVNNHSDKLAENSKKQPVNRNSSNEAVANLPYASKSVPFKNKTDVAGSQAIIQSAGNINHNASAVQVAEEQTKLAFLAGVNANQHDLGPIVKSIVSFKPLPNSVKTPTIQATATTVQPTQAPISDRKNVDNKRFHITVTPIALYQDGNIKIQEKPIPPPTPPQPPILWNPTYLAATTYTYNAGLLTDIHFKKRFSFQTGLTLSTQYFMVNSADGVAVERPDGSIKYTISYDIGIVYLDPKFGTKPAIGTIEPIGNIKTSLKYVQIPMLLNWHFGNGKLQGFMSIGGNYTMLTRISLNSDIAQERVKQNITDKEVDLRFNYLNAIAGLGLKWNFNKRLAFVLSSQYHQSITPFLKTDLIKAYPNNLTVQSGIQVGLFK